MATLADSLQLVEHVADAVLLAAVVLTIAALARLFVRLRSMPKDRVIARLYVMTTSLITPWTMMAAGIAFLILSFLVHGLTSLLAPTMLQENWNDAIRELFGAAGFLLIGVGLVRIDLWLRQERSPLLREP